MAWQLFMKAPAQVTEENARFLKKGINKSFHLQDIPMHTLRCGSVAETKAA